MERVLCLFNPQKDVSKYSVMIAEEDADIDTDLPGTCTQGFIYTLTQGMAKFWF